MITTINLIFLVHLVEGTCNDHFLPQASRILIELLGKMKGKTSIKIFGKETLPQIPKTSSYFEIKHYSLNFVMGQFYPQLIIFILSAICFIITLILTIFIYFSCTPDTSSKPGFCFIFWWIFFSLFYGVSLSYYILGILKTPFFLDNYPKIIDIIKNASLDLGNSYSQFAHSYFDLSSSYFSGENGSFGSFSTLITDEKKEKSVWKTDSLSKMIDQLLLSISSNISELINSKAISSNCNKIDLKSLQVINFPTLKAISNSLNNITNSLTIIDNENNKDIQSLGNSLKNILNDFINIPTKNPFINFPLFITNYVDIEIQKAIPSFSTNNNYYKSMRYLVYVVFCLLVIFYVFQTITFSMNNSFSRCFVVANQPISMIISLVIGIIGVISTSISCSISDLCLDSTEFATNFYFGKNEYRNLGLPKSNHELIFNSEDRYLYNVINISNIANFSQPTSEIKKKLEAINIPSGITTFSSDLNQSNHELNSLYQKVLLNDIIFVANYSSYIRREIISTGCASENERNYADSIIKDLNQLNSIIQYEIPLLIKAINSFLIYNESISKELFISSFSSEEYLNLATNSSTLTSSLFTCPLRCSKKYFCEETGGTFSYFAIFSHFYIISLIGFTLLLLFRRKSMLSPYDIKDYSINEDNQLNKSRNRWKNHFVTDDSSQMDTNSSSDSSFDMFQQSRSRI